MANYEALIIKRNYLVNPSNRWTENRQKRVKSFQLDSCFSVMLSAQHTVNTFIIILLKRSLGRKLPCCRFLFFLNLLFLSSSTKKKKKPDTARVQPHYALNNCHQVQSADGSSEIRPRKTGSRREASVGAFFVLASAWVSICARWEYADLCSGRYNRKFYWILQQRRKIWETSLGFFLTKTREALIVWGKKKTKC